MLRKRGFTLIELLVVIAVIAVLAAILFPVFAQAREKARQTTCVSNMRNIGMALAMYTQDYDEALIPWYVPVYSVPGVGRNEWRDDITTWPFVVQPYIKNGTPNRPANAGFSRVPPNGIFTCPSWNETRFQEASNRPDCNPGILDDTRWPPKWVHAHYGMSNGTIDGNCTNESPYSHNAGSRFANVNGQWAWFIMSLSEVNRVSETIYITDGFLGVAKDTSMRTMWGCQAANSHLGGGNHIFVDGHAKWLARNVERYLLTNPKDGCIYRRFFAVGID